MNGKFNRRQAHRTCTAQNRQPSATFCTVRAVIIRIIGVVHSLERTQNATDWLDQRPFIITVAGVGEQATTLQDDFGDNRIKRVTADPTVGIPGIVVIFEFQCRLNDHSLTDLPSAYEIFADFQNVTAHFVTDDNGMLRHIRRYTFVCRSLNDRFVSGRTE